MYLQLQALVLDEGLAPEREHEPMTSGASLDLFTAGPLSLDVVRHQVRIEGHPVEVTPTEFAILHTLIRNPGAVVPCTQIVQSFQGNVADEDEARQILRPHIVRLRRKLERDPSQPAHLQAVRGVGYRWQSERGEGDGALQA
jgi:DNA-binding response OmpR family regulator